MFSFKRSKSLSQEDAFKQLQENKNIQLIDVRSRLEFKDGHVKGSINMPLETVPTEFVKKIVDKESLVFVICLSGSRAESAVKIIKRLGYENTYNIGGVATWRHGLVK